MSSFRQITPRAFPFAPIRGPCVKWSRRFCSRRIVKENDLVLLKPKSNSNTTPILTSHLRPGKKIEFNRDFVFCDDILGKEVGFGTVTSRRKIQYRIHQPTLGEYTDHSPRIVTPIYSQDANLIVSQLDLHPSVPEADGDGTLEIFEAGTGHGALTLHLAKAIHGANFAAPAIPESTKIVETYSQPDQEVELVRQNAYNSWRSSRKATIHTLDISSTHSAHAQKTVKNFRNGIYFPHVDFHVGSIDAYLNSRLSKTNHEPFLDHAILDLPDTHENFQIVSKALKPNGTLVTFCPSITQINSCVLYIKENQIPFFLESVLELGGVVGVGGREWDVRPVKPRALSKTQAMKEKTHGEERLEGDILENPESATPDNKWEMVCRPKVGVKIVGGGFIGIWRRMVIEEN